jgi:hypothetical protein
MANLTYRASLTPTVPTSTTAKGSGLTNDEIDGNFKSLNDNKLELTGGTISGRTFFTNGITIGPVSDQRSFKLFLDFGADVANTWRRFIVASLANVQYSTIGFKIDIVDPNSNHATQTSVNTDLETYHVACVRTESTILDTPDICVVKGPGNRIRAVKTATGAYEIQIQNEGQYREYLISVETYAVNGAHTITYENGTVVGSTGTAQYGCSVGNSTFWVEKLTARNQILNNDDLNANGSNFLVNTSTKSTALYAFDVQRSSSTVGGIRIDGVGVFAAGTTIGGNTVLHAGNYNSYALPLNGGTLTGGLLTNIGGATSSSTKHIDLVNGTGYDLFLLPRAGSGSYNNLVADGDSVIGWSAGAVDTGALSLVPWSNTSLGLRIARNGATTLNAFYGTTQLQDNVGFALNGNYTDGRYSHRLRKFDDGGGVPLYIQSTMATAGTWSNIAKFGPNTADQNALTVYGDFNATGAVKQNGNQVLHAANYNSYAPTLTGTNASGTWGISVTGNAGTVTNGVYTSGSYADPAWITSLSKSKVGLGNVENTALSTWTGSTNITTIGATTATSLTASGIVRSTSATHNVQLGTDAGGSISIGRTDNVASAPYIDFNSGATSTDFDVRLAVTGGNGTAGNGTLALSGTLGVTNKVGIGTNSPVEKLDITVADSEVGTRWVAASARARIRPFVAGSGTIIDSLNTQESAFQPLTLRGSTLNLLGNNGTGASIDASGNLTLAGNLIVNGTTITVNSTVVTIDDPIFTLGGDTAPTLDDNKDRGIEFRWHNGTTAKIGFFGFDDSTGYLTFIPDATNTSEVFSGTLGDIQATNFRGALIGNASTATTLQTARTINGVSFNGSSNIVVPGDWTHSSRDFPNGTLVETTIDYSQTAGDPWILEIRGNSYGSTNFIPFEIQYQGYIYTDTIIHHGGYSVGTSLSGLVLFNYNGKLCFWWPYQVYWHGYNIRVYSANAGYTGNRVTSITHVAKPVSITKEVALSASIRQVLRSDNFNSYSPTLTGTGASGTWGISITGSAGSVAWTNVSGRPTAVSSFTNDSGYITSSYSGFMLKSNIGQTNPNTNFTSSAYRFDPNANNPTSDYYAIVTYGNDGNVTGQLATHYTSGQTFTRAYNTAWSSWRTQLDSSNYNSYSPTLTGTGASGNWGINITGSAAALGGYTSDLQTTTTGGDYLLIRNQTSTKIQLATAASVASIVQGAASGSWGINITGNAATATNADTVDSLHATNLVRNFGLVQVNPNGSNATLTTAQFITWLTNIGAFNFTASVMKCTWDYAGNNDISDTGFGQLELAGCVIEVFGDTATYIIRITSPSTGTGAGGVHEYINHGAGYSPGWRRPLNTNNYTTYTPTLTGTGASGTWGISITGNAATATSATDSTKLPLTGGTLTGSRPITFDTANGDIEIKGDAGGWATGLYFVGSAGTAKGGFGAYGGGDSLTNFWIGPAYNNTWMTISSSAVNTQVALQQSGNQVLHAGNYTSYSPSLTGSGASGNWSINVTGSAGSLSSNSTYMVSRGSVAAASVDSATSNGFYQQNNASDSDGLLVFAPGGSLGIFQFHATYTGVLRFRNKTDSANWTGWKSVIHDGNYSSYALPLSGGTLTGPLTISAGASQNYGVFNAPNAYGYLTLQAASTIYGYLGQGSALGDGSNSDLTLRSVGSMRFMVGGSVTRTVIDTSGNLTAAGNITAYSDERFKTDWAELSSDYIEKLANVKSGTYTRIDENLRQVGVSAQSLKEVLPEAVLEGEYLSVAYGNAALASVIELAKTIVKQNTKIAELEQLIKTIVKGQ